MDKVFVDTSFFIALLNSRDADHPHAVQLQEELASLKTRKTTSEFILLELCDGLAKLSHRELAIQVVELLIRDGLFEIIPASSDLWQAAWRLYKSRGDKEWGLTDCSSFIIMKKLGLQTALTTDKHFEQAGFTAALRK